MWSGGKIDSSPQTRQGSICTSFISLAMVELIVDAADKQAREDHGDDDDVDDGEVEHIL